MAEKPKNKPEPLIVSSPKVDTRPDRYCSICKGNVKVPCVTESEGRRRKCIR